MLAAEIILHCLRYRIARLAGKSQPLNDNELVAQMDRTERDKLARELRLWPSLSELIKTTHQSPFELRRLAKTPRETDLYREQISLWLASGSPYVAWPASLWRSLQIHTPDLSFEHLSLYGKGRKFGAFTQNQPPSQSP